MNNYWKSIEEKQLLEDGKNASVKTKEGISALFDGSESSMKANRRDFLKLFGFSVGVATVAASCEQPVKKAIPYLIKPENITPGKASYYASTFFEDNEYCSILVKVRDGRPIKIEGNELSEISQGGTSARVQGSVLSLYDTHRFKFPAIDNKEVSWDEMDFQIKKELTKIKSENKKLVILSSTVISPSTKAAIDKFKSKFVNTDLIIYDAISSSAILEANELTFGISAIPNYKFEKADVIVSFGADFLGTWLNPVVYAKGYSKKKDLTIGQKELSTHIHFESAMSLTGSNADKRIIISPGEEKNLLANLYNNIAEKSGDTKINAGPTEFDLTEISELLLSCKSKSIVVCGSNDTDSQVIVNAINHILNNYNNTIDISLPLHTKQGRDREIQKLKKEIDEGKIGGIIFYNTNPVYNLPGFEASVKKIGFTLSLSSKPNETTEFVKYLCPDHNFLESWNDYEPVKGQYSLSQPAIANIFNTRQAQESLLRWGDSETSFYDFIKTVWKNKIFPRENKNLTFRSFWDHSLQKGCISVDLSGTSRKFNGEALFKIKNTNKEDTDNIHLVLYEKVAIGSGEWANIPWLQEMPDPVSKATWDNYLNISPKLAKEKGLNTGDYVKINGNYKLPVYIQPGMAYKTVSIALGYGRRNAGLVASGTGVDIFPLVDFKGTNRKYFITDITIESTGEHVDMAITQTHHSMEGRALIRETTLEEYIENPSAGNEIHEEIEKESTTMYKKYDFPGHHWGMAIDLNKCTGCSACVIACQVENNVPSVGRREVHRVHEMHWIRIDRYYKGNEDAPEVVRQPVMCQHCDNAPCENVCPVAATNHSSEGLNQMAYNRCIGTRYCNNNCPYKVRRFNFFDYNGADAMKGNEYDPTGMALDLPRMVLNPDVTVRAKGVIEKCSFCVQRIQEKKLQAKIENRELNDGEIVPACAQACPSDAIVFGDLNNPESKVSKYYKNKRNYHLLEELHTLPSVGYLTKVRNIKKQEKSKGLQEDHQV